jgi:hypothetical protein
VSQKALTHTEHFVDEVVYVNEQLVHSLSKTKRKLRSLSSSRGGRSRASKNTMYGGTAEKTSKYNSRDTLSRDRPPLSKSESMTHMNYQTKQYLSF